MTRACVPCLGRDFADVLRRVARVLSPPLHARSMTRIDWVWLIAGVAFVIAAVIAGSALGNLLTT